MPLLMDNKNHIVVEYAGFWRRLSALAIDMLAIVSINWLLIAPWRLASSLTRPWQTEGWPAPFQAGNPFVVIFALVGVFYFVFFWSWRGQTLGKMILNIKVLKADGTRITISDSVIRFLGYIICVMTLGIGFLVLAFDERRQGLHDKMALTVVVKVPPVKMRLPEASAGHY